MAYERSSQDDLVGWARAGDDRAWEELYRRLYPRLMAYARRRLPGPEMAKDAVAEAFARAVATVERLRGEGGGFDAWLYGILRHVVLDAQRHLARTSTRLAAGAALQAVDHDADPSRHSMEAEENAMLRAAFSRLSRGDQELLELRVVAGLSAEQVAEILGRKPGAVRMAQSRALARLRQLLDDGSAEQARPAAAVGSMP